MRTKHKGLASKKANHEYYSKSDGNFMPLEQSLKAHQVLDRVAWVREHIYKLGSKFHLDVGTKDGYLPLTLSAEGVECIGVDPSVDAIEAARSKAEQANIDVTYVTGLLEDINENYVFETVSMLEVLEHVVDPDLVIQKLLRLGNYIFISTPDYEGRHGWEDSKQNDEHLRIYKKEELEELVSKYGKIIESTTRDDQLCILFCRQ